jgi:hypothetical protein
VNERYDGVSDGCMIVLDEVLQEAEVELDLDLQVTLINLFDEPWKMRF